MAGSLRENLLLLTGTSVDTQKRTQEVTADTEPAAIAYHQHIACCINRKSVIVVIAAALGLVLLGILVMHMLPAPHPTSTPSDSQQGRKLNPQMPVKVDVILDSLTASNGIQISADNRSAWVLEKADVGIHGCPCVFGQPLSMSSVVAFWEVNMGSSKRWRVGMAYRSVDVKRMYTADVQPDHGFYSLWWVEETLFALTKPQYTTVIPGTLLDHQTVDSTRVRVLLEYEDQRVTLFWNKNFTSRFSFSNQTFTEPLAPYICTYGGSQPITFIKPENFLNIPSILP